MYELCMVSSYKNDNTTALTTALENILNSEGMFRYVRSVQGHFNVRSSYSQFLEYTVVARPLGISV